MFRRFTKLVPRNKGEVAQATILTGTFCGVGYGFFRGCNESRSLPYSDALTNTIGSSFFGGYVGFLAAITLPITLPVAVCTTVFRVADDVLYKKNLNSYEIVLYKNIKMNIEDIFD